MIPLFNQVDKENLLEFYHLRRCLEDIADYALRIMLGGGGLERDQEDLRELVKILDGWS